MELEIINVHNSGDANREYVELKASQRVNLRDFILLDNSYKYDHISNIFRHAYWFPDKIVSTWETIKLYTGKGIDNELLNMFYWGSNHPVWNDGGDKAVLIKIADFQTFEVSKSPFSNILESLYGRKPRF